jgi:hypothetical protein
MRYSEKEAAQRFVSHLKGLAEYWAGVAKDKADATDGLAFSTLSLIDGCSGGSPGFNLIPLVHPDDPADTYAPYVRGKAVNKNTMMHELFHGSLTGFAVLPAEVRSRPGREVVTHGRYMAIRGGYVYGGHAHVVGPADSGGMESLASFARWDDAVRWAKDMSEQDAREVQPGISFSPTEPVLFEGTNVLHVAKPILVRASSTEQLNNVFVADSAQKRLLETVEFARGRGILGGAGIVSEPPNCLFQALQRLSIPKEKRVLLYNDFSQHSFLFQTYRETESGWVGSYNGGLIYYGAGDTGVSAPTFSCRIGSDLPEGWSINT